MQFSTSSRPARLSGGHAAWCKREEEGIDASRPGAEKLPGGVATGLGVSKEVAPLSTEPLGMGVG